MVAKVVVGVVHADIKDDSPPEFFQILDVIFIRPTGEFCDAAAPSGSAHPNPSSRRKQKWWLNGSYFRLSFRSPLLRGEFHVLQLAAHLVVTGQELEILLQAQSPHDLKIVAHRDGRLTGLNADQSPAADTSPLGHPLGTQLTAQASQAEVLPQTLHQTTLGRQ